MKKIIVSVIALSLILALSVFPVSAATDGYDFASSASSVSFNSSVTGESVVILTDGSLIPSANLKWCISVVLDKSEANGVYTVAFVHKGDGNDPAITLEDGQILLAVHSSASDPAMEDQYQNVNGKLSALALEAGDKVAFTGFDFTALTIAADATIIAGGEGSAETDESSSEDTSVPTENSDVFVPDGDPSEAESAADTESTPAESNSTVSETSESGETTPNNYVWVYIVCGVAAVIIVVVVIALVKKK